MKPSVWQSVLSALTSELCVKQFSTLKFVSSWFFFLKVSEVRGRACPLRSICMHHQEKTSLWHPKEPFLLFLRTRVLVSMYTRSGGNFHKFIISNF